MDAYKRGMILESKVVGENVSVCKRVERKRAASAAVKSWELRE
jgi:hypothetical protein